MMMAKNRCLRPPLSHHLVSRMTGRIIMQASWRPTRLSRCWWELSAKDLRKHSRLLASGEASTTGPQIDGFKKFLNSRQNSANHWPWINKKNLLWVCYSSHRTGRPRRRKRTQPCSKALATHRLNAKRDCVATTRSLRTIQWSLDKTFSQIA